jgi:hypothetical protein
MRGPGRAGEAPARADFTHPQSISSSATTRSMSSIASIMARSARTTPAGPPRRSYTRASPEIPADTEAGVAPRRPVPGDRGLEEHDP